MCVEYKKAKSLNQRECSNSTRGFMSTEIQKSHWIVWYSVTTTLSKIGFESIYGVGLLKAPKLRMQFEVPSVTVKSLQFNWAKVFCISRCILNQQIHPAWDWIIGQSYSGGDGGDNSLGSRFPYCYTPLSTPCCHRETWTLGGGVHTDNLTRQPWKFNWLPVITQCLCSASLQ